MSQKKSGAENGRNQHKKWAKGAQSTPVRGCARLARSSAQDGDPAATPGEIMGKT